MLYAAIRTYSIMPQFVVEVMQRITEGFLPLRSQELWHDRVGSDRCI